MGWHTETKRPLGRHAVCIQKRLPTSLQGLAPLVLGVGRKRGIFWYKRLLVSWGEVSWSCSGLVVCAQNGCVNVLMQWSVLSWCSPLLEGAALWAERGLLWSESPLGSIMTPDRCFRATEITEVLFYICQGPPGPTKGERAPILFFPRILHHSP